MTALTKYALFALMTLIAASTVRAEETTASSPAASDSSLTAAEAAGHIGQTSTVCGVVAETRFMSDSPSRLTFLNLDARHPDQVFSVIIEDADRAHFPTPPEIAYRGKKICVTGLIEEFRGKAQIKVKSPDQIVVQDD